MRSPFCLLATVALLTAASACGPASHTHDGGDDLADGAHADAADAQDTADVPRAPFGAPCEDDSDCASGLCARSENLTPGCSVPCTDDTACTMYGPAYACAVDRAPAGPRFACATVETGVSFPGDDCQTDDQCFSNLCLQGACSTACTPDTHCTPGWRCGPTQVGAGTLTACSAAPITAPTVEDYVLFDGDATVDHPGDAVPLVVPDDVVSLTFTARDTVGTELYAGVVDLIAPDGQYWINIRTWNDLTDQPVRDILGQHQINSSQAPSSDTLRLLPGRYQVAMALFNDAEAMTSVRQRHLLETVRIKRAPNARYAGGTLHLRVFLVGAPGGLTAATAGSDTRLQSTLGAVDTILGSQGVHVVVDGYADVSGDDGTRLGTIDAQAEMDELLTHSASTTGDVLNLFVIHSIANGVGIEGAIGISGDIVGPPGIQGTIHSGVLVAWDTTSGGAHDLLPTTTAHEIGHYLGLWHTRENLDPCTTTSQTNCSYFGGVDPITDTPTDRATSAQYLMNWYTDGTNMLVTNGQGVVLRANVLVR